LIDAASNDDDRGVCAAMSVATASKTARTYALTARTLIG